MKNFERKVLGDMPLISASNASSQRSRVRGVRCPRGPITTNCRRVELFTPRRDDDSRRKIVLRCGASLV